LRETDTRARQPVNRDWSKNCYIYKEIVSRTLATARRREHTVPRGAGQMRETARRLLDSRIDGYLAL